MFYIVTICVAMTIEADLLTSTEVSRILGVSIRTVHRRVEAGDLCALRKLPGPNGAYLFGREDVEKLLASEEHGDPDADHSPAAAAS